MLQMKRIYLLSICVCVCALIIPAQQSGGVEWMLDDALEEEFIALESSEIITQQDYRDAVQFYTDGDYRQAVVILDNLLKLNLPDGRTDFVLFLSAECYRKLAMQEKARQAYHYIIDRFPHSEKVPAAYFRLLQYAGEARDGSAADTILSVFEKNHAAHPLYNAIIYVAGKLYFRNERYAEAGAVLLKIPGASDFHFQAQFVAALSFIQLKNFDKALVILEYIRKNAPDRELLAHCHTLAGDIYFLQKKYATALSFYREVDKGSPLYNYAQVKTARIHIHQKEYQKARDIARPYVGRGRNAEGFFEMASILIQVYGAEKDEAKIAKVKRSVDKQNINARLSFEATEELVRVYAMIRSWYLIEYRGRERNDDQLVKEAHKNIRQLENLKRRYGDLLYEIGAVSSEGAEVQGLAEQRYITLFRKEINATEDALAARVKTLGVPADTGKGEAEDSVLVKDRARKKAWIDSVTAVLADAKQEYDQLKKIYVESGSEAERYGREMQAKYVDWAFMRYQEKKDQLEKMNKEIAERAKKERSAALADTMTRDTTVIKKQRPDTVKATDAVSLFIAIDGEKMARIIKDDRTRLIEHVEMLLDASPGSIFNPQVLFRLAELYYDEASDDFNRRIFEYETRIAGGVDTAELAFPEYSLDKTIELYDRIIANYPKDWLADDALFYKALALKKLGRDIESNEGFQKLIAGYPESEYFVEANMNIGNYYFTNPKEEEGRGYKLAEDAYRRVLQYRDHPQFVYAIYHLGWCYYMQDMYDEAISVFKYLIEEVDLDFDITKVEDKQVLNPLMREEAIDYIAISFNEQDDPDGAIKFLTLIGNIDYAAMVFKRIGELREEDLDYEAALKVYNRLIGEYGSSIVAPDASLSIIKILESTNKHEESMLERESFFTRYARGSPWHAANSRKDSVRVSAVDSIAIAIGLFVADEVYQNAEKEGNSKLYARAMENYERLVSAYPDNPAASGALWNYAIILDKKIVDTEKAYKAYISYSRLQWADGKRREQAALNAIGIAQAMLPAAARIESRKVESTAARVIEATKNYMELFPQGESFVDVVMNMGSVYFNRKMFSNATETYKIITSRESKGPAYFNAGFLISKCYFGEENWLKAAKGFERIWKDSPDELQKNEAYKLLLQSRFLYAKQLFDAGVYDKAAVEYFAIDKEYPGSEYGDVTLFNAAESWEKKEDWNKACDMYFELYKRYPGSKLAADALFNAATGYEKVDNFRKAAEMYELTVADYPGSAKAKDALFNVGFTYEKIGEIDKMADANEKFTRLYPDEKDVEAMLLRSAEYYYKAGLYEKSRKVYKNYIARYQSKPKSVEAYYMMGRCYQDEKDEVNAAAHFEQAESLNDKLVKSGLVPNNYFAAEAAYQSGVIAGTSFSAITFKVAPKMLKGNQEMKTEKLAEAVKAYQRVMKYKSERMFEAAFIIGSMYEEYARSWSAQEYDIKDPIKLAVAQKDVFLASAKLLKKSFEPYKKVIALSKDIDSLSPEQKKWVDTSRVSIIRNYFDAGKYMIDAVAFMQNAPIPDEIRRQILYLYQYKKQLLETLEPLKIQIRDYYLEAYTELKALAIAREAEDKCLDKLGQVAYLIPNDYNGLAEDIISSVEDLPRDLSDEEREELTFQFEDMVFELQDKALFGYEAALDIIKDENLAMGKWSNKIYARLARLSPETYGKSFYAMQSIVSNADWIAHADSVKYWNAADPFGSGWKQITIAAVKNSPSFKVDKPDVVWGDPKSSRVFLWRNAFFDGVPREAVIRVACSGKFRLFLNEKLLYTDTSGTRDISRVDSIASITSILKGGDNIIAVDITDEDTVNRGFAFALEAMIDTSQHFKSGAIEPQVEKIIAVKAVPAKAAGKPAVLPAPAPVTDTITPKKTYAQEFRNKGELLNAIAGYQKKAQETDTEVRKERLEVQKLHIKMDAVNSRMDALKKEIADLKKKKQDMTRDK